MLTAEQRAEIQRKAEENVLKGRVQGNDLQAIERFAEEHLSDLERAGFSKAEFVGVYQGAAPGQLAETLADLGLRARPAKTPKTPAVERYAEQLKERALPSVNRFADENADALRKAGFSREQFLNIYTHKDATLHDIEALAAAPAE